MSYVEFSSFIFRVSELEKIVRSRLIVFVCISQIDDLQRRLEEFTMKETVGNLGAERGSMGSTGSGLTESLWSVLSVIGISYYQSIILSAHQFIRQSINPSIK